jgi:hypothetical protein
VTNVRCAAERWRRRGSVTWDDGRHGRHHTNPGTAARRARQRDRRRHLPHLQRHRNVVQAHRDWCPAWTGRQPEIGCPYPIGRDERCGAPISRFESRPGWWLVVPGAGPNLADGHLRAADEAQRHHPGAGRVRAPMFDEVTVHPCGHVVEDEDARVLLARWGEARAAQQRRVAEERIALHADLLAATESAGHGALVDAYRRAVLAGDGTEAGLLVALRTVASDA